MTSKLEEMGYDKETAAKVWLDVCAARKTIRLALYDSNKFRSCTFMHHGLRMTGIVHDVRVTEDNGTEYSVKVGDTTVWLPVNLVNIK